MEFQSQDDPLPPMDTCRLIAPILSSPLPATILTPPLKTLQQLNSQLPLSPTLLQNLIKPHPNPHQLTYSHEGKKGENLCLHQCLPELAPCYSSTRTISITTPSIRIIGIFQLIPIFAPTLLNPPDPKDHPVTSEFLVVIISAAVLSHLPKAAAPVHKR
ncbi:hypothetical protein PGTUg99_035358 [Puccinia graminis f. sp. tritici]|uniref:Uncharacterized protein n=1 Tax=Puccinia graminis f. sp. tritici TaxID=56615 RepID=A0A5B0Q952_PUCGR|nr:hypothetical protein PGTUg99_035358 [Puccinia graminis f. sp. tritici]